MPGASNDVREVMSTNRTIGRFTDEWTLAGHLVVGWPRGQHGPVRREPVARAVDPGHRDAPAGDLVDAAPVA